VNLRVSKKGHSGFGGPAGDLMIQVKVKPHPYFKRDGSDILTDQFISISDVSKSIFKLPYLLYFYVHELFLIFICFSYRLY